MRQAPLSFTSNSISSVWLFFVSFSVMPHKTAAIATLPKTFISVLNAVSHRECSTAGKVFHPGEKRFHALRLERAHCRKQFRFVTKISSKRLPVAGFSPRPTQGGELPFDDGFN